MQHILHHAAELDISPSTPSGLPAVLPLTLPPQSGQMPHSFFFLNKKIRIKEIGKQMFLCLGDKSWRAEVCSRAASSAERVALISVGGLQHFCSSSGSSPSSAVVLCVGA